MPGEAHRACHRDQKHGVTQQSGDVWRSITDVAENPSPGAACYVRFRARRSAADTLVESFDIEPFLDFSAE